MPGISPLYTTELFPPLHRELIELLRGLSPEDWDRPTIAGAWRVRDIVAHLLDVDLRRLSVNRDNHLTPPDAPIASYADLVGFLNRLNASWIDAARRLSPRVLIEMHEFVGPMVANLLASMPPHEPARFAVSWAGERESENWFDIGREYTERWHHQMQIRDAVGAPLLLEKRWLFPLLDLSFRALPHAYRDIDAPTGTAITIRISGEGGGTWSIVRETAGWTLHRDMASDAAVIVTLDADTTWRLLYNALPGAEAKQRARIQGKASLSEPIFSVRSVMV